jgi:hypothetical protein
MGTGRYQDPLIVYTHNREIFIEIFRTLHFITRALVNTYTCLESSTSRRHERNFKTVSSELWQTSMTHSCLTPSAFNCRAIRSTTSPNTYARRQFICHFVLFYNAFGVLCTRTCSEYVMPEQTPELHACNADIGPTPSIIANAGHLVIRT